jgi:hypothetical protein
MALLCLVYLLFCIQEGYRAAEEVVGEYHDGLVVSRPIIIPRVV